MLIKARQWIKATFVEGSQPSVNTVRKWHENGEVSGVIIGGILYIETGDNPQAVGQKPVTRKWRVK